MTEGSGSVERLCEMLSHRDATIQRLEEDLLRIRMVGEANLSSFFLFFASSYFLPVTSFPFLSFSLPMDIRIK